MPIQFFKSSNVGIWVILITQMVIVGNCTHLSNNLPDTLPTPYLNQLKSITHWEGGGKHLKN